MHRIACETWNYNSNLRQRQFYQWVILPNRMLRPSNHCLCPIKTLMMNGYLCQKLHSNPYHSPKKCKTAKRKYTVMNRNIIWNYGPCIWEANTFHLTRGDPFEPSSISGKLPTFASASSTALKTLLRRAFVIMEVPWRNYSQQHITRQLERIIPRFRRHCLNLCNKYSRNGSFLCNTFHILALHLSSTWYLII